MKADAWKISDGVYWVGTLDWDLRTYHGYTLKGTTYNAYLVFGTERTALIDNTYPGTSPQMWARIADACEREGRPGTIDGIVQNHVERDHSGALPEIHRKYPDAPLYCTAIARNGLLKHYPSLSDARFVHVKTGDTLSLGGKTLAFVEAPLLHWPDSMFTMLAEDGILFPNDAFSQHLCISARTDRDIPDYLLMDAAKKFYANLITPLSGLFMKKAAELKEKGLLDKVTMIAPAHGQIWTDPGKILDAYTAWATSQYPNKVTIVYDTMHHSTQMMAHALAEGLIAGGCEVKVYYLHEDERSEIVKDILDSRAVCIGIPVINDVPYPSIGDLLLYLRGLHFDRTGKKRLALTFGSMGGKGGAVRTVAEELEKSGFSVKAQIEVTFVPDAAELGRCYEEGKALATAVRNW